MPAPFTFRMRAYAAAHFEFDARLAVTWPDMTAVLQSEYTGGADGRAYAVTLHGEMRGPAESLEDAQTRFSSAIGNILPIVALAANAAVASPLALASHGLDLSEAQPFIAYRTPGASEWFPPGKRRIDPDATLALMASIGRHPEGGLFHRATESYRRALGHWTPEERLLAGEFLFIAAETLGRCLLRTRAAELGITPKNYVQLKGAASEGAMRRTILQEDVFAGDVEALEALETASNGFEHGYMAVDEVRGLFEDVLERSAGYLRGALIRAAAPGADVERLLLSETYSEPRGLVPAIQFVTGQLTRKDTSEPGPPIDDVFVELEWKGLPVAAERTPEGEVSIELPTNVTVGHLPHNTELGITGTGLRAAHVKQTVPARVEVGPAPATTDGSDVPG